MGSSHGVQSLVSAEGIHPFNYVEFVPFLILKQGIKETWDLYFSHLLHLLDQDGRFGI